MSRFDNKPLNPFFKTWAQNLELAENLIFHKKNMVVEFFSGSDKTLKVAKNYDLCFVGWLFFVALRSHQQPMHGCNLESSRLSSILIRKDFLVQSFRKWRKNLPKTKRLYTEGASTLFSIMFWSGKGLATRPTPSSLSSNSKTESALHCTALHCTALHWTALHCTALHCTALHCTALHCTTLHCTALHCTAPHCTALHCTALHCTALHCTALHCTALHCTALHCTALYCNELHCTALHCTTLHCTALHCTALFPLPMW